MNITERDPEVVVVGYDTELTYRKLCTATTALRRGAAYIVTHSDINCPAYPEFVPDAGSIIALIGESTGGGRSLTAGSRMFLWEKAYRKNTDS